MMNKIFWTEFEETSVVEKAVDLMRNKPGMTLHDAVVKAQDVLSIERRRPVYAGLVAKLSKHIKDKLSTLQAEEKKALEFPPPLPEIKPDSQIEVLADVIGEQFAELFSMVIRSALQRTKTHLEHPEEPHKPRLPKLLILGLLPIQENEIRAEFGTVYDLRFWKNGSVHTLRSLARSSDGIIVMTDWVAHGHVDLIKSVGAGDKIRPLTGTTARLLEYLKVQQCPEGSE